MHRSRLAGFILDCKDADLAPAADFWSSALGMRKMGGPEPEIYERLDGSARGIEVEVQRVPHESRVHIDIESDDIEAEVARLEKLGAKRVGQVKTWWVMEAPTGQRFCVIRAKNLDGAAGVTTWT